jgi:hypothetical protein
VQPGAWCVVRGAWCVMRGGSPLQLHLQCFECESTAVGGGNRLRIAIATADFAALCCGSRLTATAAAAGRLTATAAAAGRPTAAPVRGSRCGAVCSAA